MLKWSSDEVKERFANRVILFIDPKFVDDNPEDQFSDFNIAKNKIIDFARRSEITEQEYLLALDMASRGSLTNDGEKVKIYREINQINLAEIERAYIEFKRSDAKFQKGKEMVSGYLNPPKKELTEEEKTAERINHLRSEYKRLKESGSVLGSVIFYDLIKKTGIIKKINLPFLEDFLGNFIPEVNEGKISMKGETQLPRVIKRDVFVCFKDLIVKHYISSQKLTEKTETEWIDHWEAIRERKTQN